jgi:hypothetical protein
MKFFKDLHNRFCSFRNKDIVEKNPLDVTSRKEEPEQEEKQEPEQAEEQADEEKQEPEQEEKQEPADEEKQDLESEIDNLIKELEHDESTIYLETPE